jgi:hypothetical protein
MREYRAFEHQAYGYEADERERIVVEIFPVLCQPATATDGGFCQIPRRPGTGRRRELSSVGSGLTWSGQSNRCSA